MRVYTVMKREIFSNRSKIHFDRLKLEGACHTSLLSKIKRWTKSNVINSRKT